MTLRRALIPGCVIALFSLETLAQEATSPAPAPETAAPAAAPAAQPAPAPAEAAPVAQPVTVVGRTVTGRVSDRLTNEGLPLVRVIIKGTTQGVETELAENMVFSMHPHAIAEDGQACLYMQDTWLVTADGGEPLADLPLRIFAAGETRPG